MERSAANQPITRVLAPFHELFLGCRPCELQSFIQPLQHDRNSTTFSINHVQSHLKNSRSIVPPLLQQNSPAHSAHARTLSTPHLAIIRNPIKTQCPSSTLPTSAPTCKTPPKPVSVLPRYPSQNSTSNSAWACRNRASSPQCRSPGSSHRLPNLRRCRKG